MIADFKFNTKPTMKRILTLVLTAVAVLTANAQMADPVRISASLKTNSSAEGEIVFSGTIDQGWHVYSTNLGADGPIEASFHLEKADGIELVGRLMPRGKEISQYDNVFGMTLRYFERNVGFTQKVRFTKPQYTLSGYLEYGVCNDQSCLPPQECAIKKQGKSPSFVAAAAASDEAAKGSKGGEEALKANEAAAASEALTPDLAALTASADSLPAPSAAIKSTPAEDSLWWQPSVEAMKAYGGTSDVTSHSLWYIFMMGVIGGLLALVMPCIWPIIPMTIGFFLRRAKDNRRRGICDALLYGASIVVIFLALGLLVTLLFGPSKLNELSTSAVFNVFLFVLLVVFAMSFFGWFEIKLPDKWSNSVDTKASNTSGIISIFLMAFTLVLVSFSCTAPIIGLLLVETVTTSNWIAPTVGMLGFALALAVPFALFAMFPSWLKSAPKSGSWMNTIKVVLGFVELAFSLKFLSVADLAYGWHILDREVFLSLWIVIFGAMGCYLIGWLRFPIDTIGGADKKPKHVASIILGLCSLAFAAYMMPGLWGAPCKAVSAFSPPMSTQDFVLGGKTVKSAYTNYEEGMAAARQQHKPVLIDFTGFGCVNCRKMEAAVWTDASVADVLNNDYVLISLFVDDKTPLDKPLEVEENGRAKTLRTVGAKWSYLQSHKFGANTQPFYVPVDNDGNPLSAAYSYNESVPAYLKFLDSALKKYRAAASE